MECGPDIYLALVEDEIRTVAERIGQAEEGRAEPLQRLLAILRECAAALRNAGVGLVLHDQQLDVSQAHLADEVVSDNDLGLPTMNGHNPNWWP